MKTTFNQRRQMLMGERKQFEFTAILTNLSPNIAAKIGALETTSDLSDVLLNALEGELKRMFGVTNLRDSGGFLANYETKITDPVDPTLTVK